MEDGEERTSRLMKVSSESLAAGNPQSDLPGHRASEILAKDSSMVVLLQASLAPPCSDPQVWRSLAFPDVQSLYLLRVYVLKVL